MYGRTPGDVNDVEATADDGTGVDGTGVDGAVVDGTAVSEAPVPFVSRVITRRGARAPVVQKLK